jgi:hypothetical protein
MSAVDEQASQGQSGPSRKGAVVGVALTAAGASASGLTAIIGVAAYGAIPAGLAYAAIGAFSFIMLGALTALLAYIRR